MIFLYKETSKQLTTGYNFVYYYFGYVCLKIRQLFSQFLKEKGLRKENIMTLIEFVTITEEKVKKELKNKQGLEDTSIITLKLQDPDAINTKVRYLLEASNKEGKKKCVSLNTYYKTYKEDLEKTDIGSLSDGAIPTFFDIIITDIISQIKKAFAA